MKTEYLNRTATQLARDTGSSEKTAREFLVGHSHLPDDYGQLVMEYRDWLVRTGKKKQTVH